MSISSSSPRHRRPSRAELAILALAALLAATTAIARSDDRNQPMDIRADHSRMTQGSGKDGGVTVLTGNVKVTRGTMKASAAQATLYQHPDKARDAKGNDVSNQVQRVVLTGKPAHLEEVGDDGDKVTSSADRIEYDADTSIAVLDGNVSVIREGRSQFNGEHMVYNTRTGAMESGNLDGSAPVHIVIQPKAKPAAAPAKPAADGGAG
ncbi:MAG: lipopolysaccharide transport periplasmic protein LptA [Dokdonella sp.]|uniref:lipopolysaccharide transport periplasmic protein LptA n=1 Tax=Dokdonella sp. TaxID=2291710 RepID=UPI0025C1C09B|nr:lipopolysaccharide transport periplasmic protein LptA [Dokdonella sp.]MBZ0222780.1 lipopolysaccharide transport periplasmic protein LptA [Dokdonella sp.]MCC7255931.1 lipopolysaccharide transport periplasmic protein LptA [Dokdonella sp.]